MNINKLVRFLCGEIPNSKAIPIADFVNKLENDRNFEDDFASWKYLSGSYAVEYKNLLSFLITSESGESKLKLILDRLGLPGNFIDKVDLLPFQCNNCGHIESNHIELATTKSNLLAKVTGIINVLKNSKNNKYNGNTFEEICEEFLLCSSYFEPGFQEFAFEDGTGKIDRLLKLKKHIINHINSSEYGYVIFEAKYKTSKEVSAGETGQLKEYIERLGDNGMSQYAISITSNGFKGTYKTKLGDRIGKKVNQSKPYFISLFDIEEVKEFLENKGSYENMSFDEFIERSFIKWLK